ncbi:MAG TPA: aminofutalosine synthase MqnE [Bacteroidota bacterium]|nr:aminofutalosine synthase MqnE [Bacteroidota bacterium]
MNQVHDSALNAIWQKVRRGERLSLLDGLQLYHTQDIIGLGKLAHYAQQARSGDAVYFVLNQKIEPTNICVLSCKFCDFATKKHSPRAYEMSTEEILSKLSPEIREVHVTGGMPPDWPWERYLDIVRSIHRALPDADIKAFTAVEIDFFHKKFRMSVEEVLRQLQAAGLRTMPGGGAEIFSERVRRHLFPQKIGARGWFEVHKTAHRLGIPTNSTMLYGHIETLEERLVHMIKLREAQDETGGFLTFVPLAFQPGTTGIKPRNQFTSAVDDLKTIAVSRLMLDNIPHIKAYWVMLTEEVASVALNFGADDIDGRVGGEKIAHDAGAISPLTLAKDRLIRIITDAGKIPVERDAYYNPLQLHAKNVIGKIPYLNSVPFYEHFSRDRFKVLPVVPRRMGILCRKGEVDAGPFSLMDYFSHQDHLDLMDWCIANHREVLSVLLFSRVKWEDLGGATIGISDGTATSIYLLKILLEKKYHVKTAFRRLHSGVNDWSTFDGILLIGDEALRGRKYGVEGFPYVFDLAREWQQWQDLPFVFAVWARQRAMTEEAKAELDAMIGRSLEESSKDFGAVGAVHGRRIGLSLAEVADYLAGFTFRIGSREKEAMERFKQLVDELEPLRETVSEETVI